MDAEELLARVTLFRSLNKRQIGTLARFAASQQYAPSQVIVQQGDTGVGLFVIASGRVEVRQDAQGGGLARVLRTLGPGDYFGEMALLDDAPRSASVVAIEPTECLTLTKWHFLAQLEQHPEMALPMLPVLSRRVRAAEDRLEAAQAGG
jgi:CRP-like cAMP-binding protein